MDKLQNIKIAYNSTAIFNDNVYKQKITITEDILEYFINEISKKINQGLEYGDYTEFPKVGINSNNIYSLNLSTAKFIKRLLPSEVQKRFKLDINSYLYIKKLKGEV